MEQTITIDLNWWQGESQTDIAHLRDIEFRIIAQMYQSEELFNKITNQLSVDDFTFIINKRIYEYLLFYAKENSFFGDDSKKTEISLNIYYIHNIDPASILKIFNCSTKHVESIYDFAKDKKEYDLDLDIFELLDFSKKRQEIISKDNDGKKAYINIEIEDEYGTYHVAYENGIVIEIDTTYIFRLPVELCDTFEYTNENIMPYIQTDNNDMTIIVNEDDPEDIQTICLKKNIAKIELVERLIEWGNKNKIDHNKFSRNKGSLWQYDAVEEFDECNIKDIPSELFEVKQKSFSFNFQNNKIKSLPSNISNSKCSALVLCNNQFKEFPKSVYELKELSILYLHGNKIKSVPDDIDKLKKLESLMISNNPISKLPLSTSNITTLTKLEMENTLIDEDSLNCLHLEKLEKISFDDRLLPWFIKNFHRLKNIDVINLVHSNYSENDKNIKALGLEFDSESWMAEEDLQGHGSIVLKKLEEDNMYL